MDCKSNDPCLPEYEAHIVKENSACFKKLDDEKGFMSQDLQEAYGPEMPDNPKQQDDEKGFMSQDFQEAYGPDMPDHPKQQDDEKGFMSQDLQEEYGPEMPDHPKQQDVEKGFMSQDLQEAYGPEMPDHPKQQDDGKGFMSQDIQEDYGPEMPDLPKQSTNTQSKYMKPNCPCYPNMTKRFTVAILSSIGFLITSGIRCNLAVALMEMVSSTPDKEPEFDWTFKTISIIVFSFLWGYLVTQIPGGFLAAKYPANRVFGTAICVSAILNMLLPGAAKMNPAVVILVRILQGLVEGVTYPACHGIWRHWAPPMERSRLATLAFCGSFAGNVVGMPLSRFLTDLAGWQASFYFYGFAGMVWYLFWMWLSFERPSKHPTISQEELTYIENSIGKVAQSNPTLKTIPWKAMFTSMPVYAIIVADFCWNWSFRMMHSHHMNMEVYLSDIANVLLLLPELLMTLVVPVGGYLADTLRRREILTTTAVRKIFNCGGFALEAAFLLWLGYARSTVTQITALTLASGFSGFAISSFYVNHLDIAPRYASILMGISNGFGTLAGMICPNVVESLTIHKTADEWQKVFLIAGFIHFGGLIFYAIFGSGEKQSWAEPPPEDEGPSGDPLASA